ncbi:hypothetical protein CRG98_045374 [Punica granatum]|uniref:peroxidase n=1 Tax=Punica granatum TaxID=22663 RepID=A0A2I0HR92_PUNGR|nr:hypothetical protein CRG98_045374 [Punica granatum]
MQTFRAPSFILAVSMLLMAAASARQLRADFNNNTCLNAEHLVRSAVTRKFQLTDITAPATLRHSFHDCFVRIMEIELWIVRPNKNCSYVSHKGIGHGVEEKENVNSKHRNSV